jgi:hypothetical protein
MKDANAGCSADSAAREGPAARWDLAAPREAHFDSKKLMIFETNSKWRS